MGEGANGANGAAARPATAPASWEGTDVATLVQAIRMALHVGEERHGVTDIFGEDVGPPLGGVFTQTQGLQDRVELAARRARHRRHGDGPRHGRAAPGRRDPVLRLRVQHHRPAQARRRHLLVVQRRLQLPHGADDARGQRHPRQHLPLALVRRAGHAHARLEDRDAVQPARRVRPPAVGDRRSEPGHVPGAQGAAARQGRPRRAHPGRARRRAGAVEDDRRAPGRPLASGRPSGPT